VRQVAILLQMRSAVALLLALAIGCAHAPAPRPAFISSRERAPLVIGKATAETRAAAVVADASPTVAEAVQAGKHWRVTTDRGPVHVWVPAGFDRRTAMTIVYIHGYWTDVDRAWAEHQLPSQFARSGLNAMFVACGGPETYTDPVVWDSLPALLDAVETGIDAPMAHGRVVAVGHSAAWRTLTAWVTAPDDPLDTLVMFDALYEVPQFLAWIKASRDHRLIDVGDDTRPWTEQLHRALPESIVLEHMPDLGDDLPRGSIDAHVLYIKSEVGHMPLVTGGAALPTVLRALTDERVRGAPIED